MSVQPAAPTTSLELPVGGIPDSGAPAGPTTTNMVASTYEATAPEIKQLIQHALCTYTESNPEKFKQQLKHFAFNAEFDGPTYFYRGTERAKVFNWVLGLLFERVEAEPKIVRVTMLSDRLGLIEVDATLKVYGRLPRVWPVTALVPDHQAIHSTFQIVAKGDDDKIVKLKERAHNLPALPQLPRALATTAWTTAVMMLTMWP